MAENLDPRELEEFNRNMKELNDILPSLHGGFAGMSGAQRDATKNTKENSSASSTNTELIKARNKAEQEAREALNNLRQALGSASQAVGGFKDALLKAGGGFEKYNSAMSSAGDAALSLGKNFGAAGLALGGFIKGLTVVGQMYTKQADAILKSSDELSEMGVVGEITSKELLEMAQNAGYSSKNMEGFVKATKSLGTDMLMLGGTVNGGTREFAKLTELNKQQVDAYRKMGISQEELNQMTADSIKLMSKSGQVVTERMKQDGSLKTIAKEYTDSLIQLSMLTGENVQTLKKQKEAALANIGVQIMLAEKDKKARDLEDQASKETNAERKKQLLDQAKAQRDEVKRTGEMLVIAKQSMNAEQFAGFQKMVTTGAITKESASFARSNPQMLEFIDSVKKGAVDPLMLKKKLADDLDKTLDTKGTAAKYSEEAQKDFNMSLEGFANRAAMAGKSTDEYAAEVKRARDKQKLEAAGLGPEDAAKEARNKTMNLERDVQVGLDKLLAAANPLISGFNATTVAATALAAAAVAASVSLGKMAAGKMMGSVGGKAGEAAKEAAKVSGGSAKALGKGLGVGAIGAAGAAGLGMFAENQAAKGNTKTAAAADVGSSALSGASLGATIGSIVPGVGTAIGAAVGGVLGAGYGFYQNRGIFDKGEDGGSTRGVNTALPPEPKGAVAMPKGGEMSDKEIKDMIIRHEGKRNEPYKDSLGLWTVGIGHLIGDGKSLPDKWNRRFTDDEVMALFDLDYDHHKQMAQSNIPNFSKVSSMGQGALIDLTFNMGGNWINKFKNTKKALEDGNTELAASNLEQSKWYTQVGNRAPTITGMLRNSKISASVEGIVSGPESGWNAVGHGTEIMKRLQPDSILDKLANTPATQASSSGMSSEDIANMLAEAFDKFSVKLDDAVTQLVDLNSVQSDILKYSKA